MRVTVTIEDRLWKDAHTFFPGRTQRELIEGVLYELVRIHRPGRLVALTHITPLITTRTGIPPMHRGTTPSSPPNPDHPPSHRGVVSRMNRS